MLKTSFAIQVIRSRYEGMISMFCSQCGAPMGDNDKFCGACGAPNAGAATSAPQGQPQQFVPQPVVNVPKGCVAQAFEDMTKMPGVLQRVCQIAFLPALICVVSAFWRPVWQARAVRALASNGVATCRLRSMTAWIVR